MRRQSTATGKNVEHAAAGARFLKPTYSASHSAPTISSAKTAPTSVSVSVYSSVYDLRRLSLNSVNCRDTETKWINKRLQQEAQAAVAIQKHSRGMTVY